MMMKRQSHRSLFRRTVAQQLMLDPIRARHYLQSEWTAPSGGGTASLTIDTHGDLNYASADAAKLIAPVNVRFVARPTGFDVSERAMPDPTTVDKTTAVNVYDDAFHDIYYYWEVTTAPAGYAETFQPNYLLARTFNIPTVYNKKKIRYGKSVDFVFDVPGDYVVTCFAVDNTGNRATATVSFQSGGDYPAIRAITDYVTGSNVICVNPSGDSDFSWSPDAGSNNFYTTGDPLNDDDEDVFVLAKNAFNGDTNKVLFFKPGATYDYTKLSGEVFSPSANEDKTHIWIGTPLGETPAQITTNGNFFEDTNFDGAIASYVVFNLICIGNGEQCLAWGSNYSNKLAHKIHMTGYGFPARLDCQPGSGSPGNTGTTNNQDGVICLSECSITDYTGYGVFANPCMIYDRQGGGPEDDLKFDPPFATKFALIGCDIYSAPGQESDGPIRFGYFRLVNMAHSRIYQGANQPGSDVIQPALRPNGNTGQVLTHNPNSYAWSEWQYMNFSCMTLEGGSWSGLHGSGGAPTANSSYPIGRQPINLVADKIVHIAIPPVGTINGTSACIGENIEGMPTCSTFRNILFVAPSNAVDVGTFIRWGNGGSDITPVDADDTLFYSNPVNVYNVTAVILKSSGTPPFQDNVTSALRPSYTNVNVANNIYHAPNLASVVDGSVVASTLAGLSFDHPNLNGTSGAAFGDTLWTPSGGANNYSSGDLATWDYAGTTRPSKKDPKTGSTVAGIAKIGAVEP